MNAEEELRRLREKTEQLYEELKEFQKHEHEEYLRYVEEGNQTALNRALGQSWGFETAHDLVKNYLRFDEMKKAD